MPPWPEYAVQCAELEKMARLGGPEGRSAPLPGLADRSPQACCLVCGARPARPCAGCGGVAYCDESHQRSDARWHGAVCDRLRELAEELQDAKAAPPPQVAAELQALLASAPTPPQSWSDIFNHYTNINNNIAPARLRRMTDFATRPLTLTRAIARCQADHGLSAVTRVHVMAASQRELEVSPALWPAGIELTLIGPELPATPSHPAIRTHAGLYRPALWAELGRPDLVIGYNCGLLLYPSWKPTMLELRGSGVLFIITSYRPWEAEGEARVLTAIGATRLFGPEPGPFASLASKRSKTLANDVSHDNAFISAWR